MSMPLNLRIGLRGEQLTAAYLRKHGYTICASNFSTALGETDLIALSKDATLCFIEVKTRSPGAMLAPSEAVDHEKQRRLVNNASAFINTAKDIRYKKIRFDIAEVILSDLRHAEINLIENAFGYNEFPE